jgi:hypothetical protein
MKDMLKDIKVEEMLKCFMLIIVGYFIAKLFSKTCNGFNVGGQVGGQPVPVMCNPKATPEERCPYGNKPCPQCGKDACPCPQAPPPPPPPPPPICVPVIKNNLCFFDPDSENASDFEVCSGNEKFNACEPVKNGEKCIKIAECSDPLQPRPENKGDPIYTSIDVSVLDLDPNKEYEYEYSYKYKKWMTPDIEKIKVLDILKKNFAITYIKVDKVIFCVSDPAANFRVTIRTTDALALDFIDESHDSYSLSNMIKGDHEVCYKSDKPKIVIIVNTSINS